jgi:hypothetical protein
MGRVGTAILVVSLLVYSLCAQEPTSTKCTVPVGILDQHGDVPRDLSVGAFMAELDRKPLEITTARLYSGPRRVAILLDTSGSMRKGVYSSGKASLAYWVVADAITRLPADVSIAVVDFNERVDRKLDFSVSRGRVASEIKERAKSPDSSMRGKTALFDAIENVLDQVPNPTPGDAIYVITDGVDNRSHIGVAQLEKRLQQVGVRLHLFLLRDFLWTGNPLPGSSETMMLAHATGGAVIELDPTIHGTGTSGTTESFALSPERQRTVSDELALLYRQTYAPYLLEVKLPAVLNKQHNWKLNVADQERRKSMYLFYPRHIVPCERVQNKR